MYRRELVREAGSWLRLAELIKTEGSQGQCSIVSRCFETRVSKVVGVDWRRKLVDWKKSVGRVVLTPWIEIERRQTSQIYGREDCF